MVFVEMWGYLKKLSLLLFSVSGLMNEGKVEIESLDGGVGGGCR